MIDLSKLDFLDRYAVLSVITEGHRARLRQDKIWKDKQGRIHLVSGIDPRYARNIISFLERRATVLYEGAAAFYIFADVENMADMAHDSFVEEHSIFCDLEPIEWLHHQPLIKALEKRASA